MRITYIVAGAGGMYCGACARDAALIRELIARGHDVSVTALYTPFHSDDDSVVKSAPIYYGGINVYLQQISALFRVIPTACDRLFDNPALLRWVSKFAIRTRAEELGPMTLSVLEGRNGRQKKELSRLIAFLKQQPECDVVNITNSMLSGIAVELKAALNVPVVCTLQGEDGFVNSMPEPYKSKARELMMANSQYIDAFISPSENYADSMSRFLGVDRQLIKVVRAGINTDTYHSNEINANLPYNVGYLSVITPAKGLDILVDAFITVVNQHGCDVNLQVAGKVLDDRYFKSIKQRITSEGLDHRFVYHGEVDLSGKINFLMNCHLFAVPARIEESRGMAAMEAMSMGIPLVVPDAGVFPEMMELTGGGLVYRREDSADLAETILKLIRNPETARVLGEHGADGIRRYYSASQMADDTLRVYAELLALSS